MTNGNSENSTEPLREDDGDGPIGKRKPPWVIYLFFINFFFFNYREK